MSDFIRIEDLQKAFDALDLIPIVDVVEVVRCKDCKYWRDTDHTCKHSFTSPRCANDFCSYGERADA